MPYYLDTSNRLHYLDNDQFAHLLPAGVVQISDEEAEALQHPPRALADIKADALVAIDAAAGRARARYITIAPGQEATYLLKSQQATAYQAAGYTGTVPGLVQAEVTATGATAQQATDAMLAQEAAWATLAAAIESARRSGKVTAGNAADGAAVATILAATLAQIDAI